MNEAVATPGGLRKRNALLAAIGAWFVAPVAFAYVQRIGWGIAFALAPPMSMMIAGRTGLAFVPGAYPILSVLPILVVIAAIVAAVVFARRVPEGATPRWYNRWYHYLWMGALTLVVTGYLAANRGAVFGAEPYRIPSTSMEPTIAFGDFIVADYRANTMAEIHRGDIVIFVPKAHPDQRWQKRVVGLPGESIVARDHRVSIDGKALDEPWQTVRDGVSYPGDFESVTLGPDEYYLMGDNRPNSEDSRYTGPVKRNALLAKVRTIWLHYSPEHGIDTSRIGLKVDAPAR
ncbi:signal peptidase I [Lysobacter sp. A6]|uniref:Signal peptidase I n=1 Tax=Noviluteimonas lactosilytica TaxID=2888523 RepID=A0ABS8JL27_9GAMM|nr:signal peptidase I [Lysobacter lactosilyticus]